MEDERFVRRVEELVDVLDSDFFGNSVLKKRTVCVRKPLHVGPFALSPNVLDNLESSRAEGGGLRVPGGGSDYGGYRRWVRTFEPYFGLLS